MELKNFNDAWRNKNESKLNDGKVVRLLTDFSFNFTSKKWENGKTKYDHDEIKFISSVVTAGIDRHSDLECRRNLNDIIGFVKGGYRDVGDFKLVTSDFKLMWIFRECGCWWPKMAINYGP